MLYSTPEQLAEDELRRRHVGDEQHVERPAVALGRDRRDRLGGDQQQAQHGDRHEAVGGGERRPAAGPVQRRSTAKYRISASTTPNASFTSSGRRP